MIDNIEEKRRFAALMTALADYYEKSLSKGVLALYWEGLRQYDYEAIEKAAWAHTQLPDEAGRWMPKVSDLNKMLAPELARIDAMTEEQQKRIAKGLQSTMSTNLDEHGFEGMRVQIQLQPARARLVKVGL